MSSRRYWSRRRPTKRNGLPKMVFEVPAEEIYKKGFFDIRPDSERNPYKLCSALVEKMQEHIPGAVKKISIGRNGDRVDGACIGDFFGRKGHNQALAKAYPFVEKIEDYPVWKIRVVYPGGLGPEYLKELTGLNGDLWKRRA